MEHRYRLTAGQVGPTQQSSISCGAACLAVARMLSDPGTARWIFDGPAVASRGVAGENPADRFARLERHLHRRTNSVLSYPGRVQPPWPRSLGMPPWGAAAELQRWAERLGTAPRRYGILQARHLSANALGRLFDDVLARVRPGEPAVVYVGSDVAPRHVCLLFRDASDGRVLLYEPYTGQVSPPSREAFARSRLGLAGWDRVWWVVAPGAQAPIAVWALRALVAPPRGVPGPAMLREGVLLGDPVTSARDVCLR